MKRDNKQDAAKTNHPVALRLEHYIRKKLSEQQKKLGLSDEALGQRTFKPLGWSDGQKKANNLLRGQTKMLLSDFYILCEGLDLQPDRVFTSSLISALEPDQTPTTGQKKSKPKTQPNSTKNK